MDIDKGDIDTSFITISLFLEYALSYTLALESVYLCIGKGIIIKKVGSVK